MKQRAKNRLTIIVALLFLGGGIYLAYSKNGDAPGVENGRAYDKNIPETSEAIINNEDALYSYVRRFGAKAAMIQLNSLAAKYGDCHTAAHKAGRFAYELYDREAFRQCSAECHSGCYHGATEMYFKKNGTANLEGNLKILCNEELNAFFSHQCLHGIGHGLMAWTEYNLPEALTSCELLPQSQQLSCWSGVFMENIVGGLEGEANPEEQETLAGHFTKFLNDDPHYPCDGVDKKYGAACYLLQTSRMLQLFNRDFKKVADACTKAPSDFRRICFESMGRDVGGSFTDPATEIATCDAAPAGNDRIGCLVGAVQDSFWDEGGQTLAIRFCRLLTKPDEESACYDTLFGRAPQVIFSTQGKTKFCESIESAYKDRCFAIVR